MFAAGAPWIMLGEPIAGFKKPLCVGEGSVNRGREGKGKRENKGIGRVREKEGEVCPLQKFLRAPVVFMHVVISLEVLSR